MYRAVLKSESPTPRPSVIVARYLMVIVIRDSDRSGVDVHVNHLDPAVLLYL